MNQTPTTAKHGRRDGAPPVAAATEDLQSHIGIQLRAVYESMIAEPVPDRFLKLLEELEKPRDGGS